MCHQIGTIRSRFILSVGLQKFKFTPSWTSLLHVYQWIAWFSYRRSKKFLHRVNSSKSSNVRNLECITLHMRSGLHGSFGTILSWICNLCILQKMKEALEALEIYPNEAQIETPDKIGTGKRYHTSIRSAYEKIRADTGHEKSDKECQQLVTLEVNCTGKAKGLRLALISFGAILKSASSPPVPPQLERAIVIDRVMKEVAEGQARRKITFGSKHKNGPRRKERSAMLRHLTSGNPELVYRTKRIWWKEALKLISTRVCEGRKFTAQRKEGYHRHDARRYNSIPNA